jgi:hypothetical protein
MKIRNGSSILAVVASLAGLVAVGVGGFRLVNGNCPLTGDKIGCCGSKATTPVVSTTPVSETVVKTEGAVEESDCSAHCSEAAECPMQASCDEKAALVAEGDCQKQCPYAAEQAGQTAQAEPKAEEKSAG